MASPAHSYAVLPAYTTDQDAVRTADALDDWVPSDSTKIDVWVPGQHQRQSCYPNIMDWYKDNERPGATPLVDQVHSDAVFPNDNPVDEDLESRDRVMLLAKKYATEKVSLSKEDNARLEMINQKMSLKYPRYSTEDWELLDKAESLINELSST